MTNSPLPQFADVEAAAKRLDGQIVRTPCTKSYTLSSRLGVETYLKLENFQFTASFKERGALNFLLANRERLGGGVLAMSAGNHAQALAYHGQRMGIPTTVVMPRFTPNTKVESTRVFGAEVHLEGENLEASRIYAEAVARDQGLTMVHPFNDRDVIAGQGTVALEVLEDIADLTTLVVPIGGGGLIGGIAIAAKAMRDDIEIIGVQAERYSWAYGARHQPHPAAATGSLTVAEGIAVEGPGNLTRKLIDDLVDDVHVVSESEIEQSIFDMLEVEKIVTEGAGAAPLALLTKHPDLFHGKKVGILVTGGNIDMMVLSSVLQRGLVRSNKLVRISIEIPDRPGAMSTITAIIANLDSNIIDIEHQRTFAASSARATVVEILLQMRGEEQTMSVIEALEAAGYRAWTPDAPASRA